MNDLEALLQSNAFYILPSWPYMTVYVFDIIVFVYGFQLIARRTFIFSIYVLGYTLLSVPDIILYPTDRSRINIVAVGGFFYDRYIATIDNAFFVTSVGFWVFVLAIRLTRKRPRAIALGRLSELLSIVLFSRNFCLLLFIIQALLTVALVMIGGSLGSASKSGFVHPEIRPVIVVLTYLSTFNLTIYFARLFYRRSTLNLCLLFATLALTATLGARHAIFVPLLYFISLHAWWRRDKNLIKYGFYIAAIFILVQIANLFRADSNIGQGLGSNNLLVAAFFGNNFSDLRDFGLILSGWNGAFLDGKTYVSAFLGFIPSSLFPLREAWNIGPTTLQLSDLYVTDPNHLHPGLRGTFIAESYINFGYFGVVLMAIFVGRFLLYDFAGMRAAVDQQHRAEFVLRAVRYEFVLLILEGFYDTSSFSTIYFIGLILILVFVLRANRYRSLES